MNNQHGNFFVSPLFVPGILVQQDKGFKKQQKGLQSEKKKRRQIDNSDINSYTTQSLSYLGFLSLFHFFSLFQSLFPPFFLSFFFFFVTLPLSVVDSPDQKQSTAIKN